MAKLLRLVPVCLFLFLLYFGLTTHAFADCAQTGEECNNGLGTTRSCCNTSDVCHSELNGRSVKGICRNAASVVTPTPTSLQVCSMKQVSCSAVNTICQNNSDCCSGTCQATDTGRGVYHFCTAPLPNAPTPTPKSVQECHTYLQATCSSGSICYDGNYDSTQLVPGGQCGDISNWHWGKNSGGTNVPACGINAYCCDQGPVTVVVSPPPPPCLKDSNGHCYAVATGFGNVSIDTMSAISALFGVLLSFAGGVVLLVIIFAGYRLMVSQGDPEKIKNAREMLTAAIIGLLFVIFSVTILRIIGVDILHIPGLSFQ